MVEIVAKISLKLTSTTVQLVIFGDELVFVNILGRNTEAHDDTDEVRTGPGGKL